MTQNNFLANVPVQRGTLSLAALRNLAAVARERLEAAWQADTAHHSVDYDRAGSRSAGQCYVSCMAFVRMLQALRPATAASIFRGQLIVGVGCNYVVADHGWVVVETQVGRVIVDLTVDQAIQKTPTLVEPEGALPRREYFYSPRDKRTLESVTNIDVWSRYLLLESRLFAAHGDYKDWL